MPRTRLTGPIRFLRRPSPFSAVVLLAIIALFAPSGRGQTQAPSPRTILEPRGTAGNRARHQSGHVACARYAGDAPASVDSSGLGRGRSHRRLRDALPPRTRDRQVQGRCLAGFPRVGALGRARQGHDVAASREPGLRHRADRSGRRRRGRGAAFRGRPEVEYAQAAYRVHAAVRSQ